MIVFLHVQFETTLELEPGDKTNLDYSNLHLANSNMLYGVFQKKWPVDHLLLYSGKLKLWPDFTRNLLLSRADLCKLRLIKQIIIIYVVAPRIVIWSLEIREN